MPGAANLNVVPRRGGGRGIVSEQSGGRSSRSYDSIISSYINGKIVLAVSSTDVPRSREVTGVCIMAGTATFRTIAVLQDDSHVSKVHTKSLRCMLLPKVIILLLLPIPKNCIDILPHASVIRGEGFVVRMTKCFALVRCP